MSQLSARRAYLRRENKKYGNFLEVVPREQWPNDYLSSVVEVRRSNRFLVQCVKEKGCLIRLSVTRTMIDDTGAGEQGTTWDELQDIKRQCGYGEHYAVEVYPRDHDTVNVANLRHLWILEEPLGIGWFK